MRTGSVIARAVALTAVVAGALVSDARATIQDFGGPPAGTVLAGERPDGGTEPGTLYPDFSVSVTNHGDGPHSALIFDSSNPTGGDFDLGSPNETCSPPGPGVGTGGEVGQPGENCVAQGNLLIVADNITDTAPEDGLVDAPNDEAGGGELVFQFQSVVVVESMVLMDIDAETAEFNLLKGGVLKGTVHASDLGDNSVQTVDLNDFGPVNRVELTFSGSGAVSAVEYFLAAVPVEIRSWAELKATYR